MAQKAALTLGRFEADWGFEDRSHEQHHGDQKLIRNGHSAQSAAVHLPMVNRTKASWLFVFNPEQYHGRLRVQCYACYRDEPRCNHDAAL